MKLTLKAGRQNKVHLLIDGEYRMTVDSDFLSLSGIHNNMELNETELANLAGNVNSRRAFNKAIELLSRRDHSAAELLTKLRQKGYADGAEAAVERLTALGYLDDRRFAATYAAELQRLKTFGKRRIESELFRKGVDREIIRDVLDAMETPEDTLQTLIERKYMRNLDSEKGIQKTVNALVRMGYGYSEIRQALAAVTEMMEVQEEAE